MIPLSTFLAMLILSKSKYYYLELKVSLLLLDLLGVAGGEAELVRVGVHRGRNLVKFIRYYIDVLDSRHGFTVHNCCYY